MKLPALQLPKYSIGVGDRFAHQAKAQVVCSGMVIACFDHPDPLALFSAVVEIGKPRWTLFARGIAFFTLRLVLPDSYREPELPGQNVWKVSLTVSSSDGRGIWLESQ